VFANALARLNSCAENGIDVPDQHHNIMDYSTPSVRQTIFTAGQRDRAHSFVATPGEPRRYDMWQEANHEATGIGLWGQLEARFAADLTHTFMGVPIRFKDYSRNIAETYEWTFEGGNPATSSDPSPTVTWDAPGTYDVTLRVTNRAGSSEVTLPNYITISGTRVDLPITAAFATGVPNGWRVDNPDAGKQQAFTSPFTWEFQASSGEGTANGALIMRNSVYPDIGQRDALVLPYLNVSDAEGVKVAFAYNYRPVRYSGLAAQPASQPLVYTDTLLVQASPDGGRSWFTLWKRGGLQLNTWSTLLETTDAGNAGQTPSGNSNWRRDTTCVQADLLRDTLMLRFLNINGMGGNIYLDNVSVFESSDFCQPTGRTQPSRALAQFVAFPNPTTDKVWLQVESLQAQTLRVQVLDAQGRVVIPAQTHTLTTGSHTLQLSLGGLPAGLYLIQGRSGSQQVQARVVKP
jgi:PKD repeat protein